MLLIVLSMVPATALAEKPVCTSLNVSGNAEYPPLLWTNPNDSGELIGAVPALLREILEPLKIEAHIHHRGSWARVQHLAKAGEIDMIAGAFMTRERFQYMDYILPPIMHLPTAIWVPKGQEFLYRHWPDLKGKVGSTLIGNSFGQNFDRYADEQLSIEPVRSIDQSFLMAEAGRVNYVLYELLQGQVKLAREGRSEKFVALGKPISTEGLFFTFPKKSRCNTFEFREQVADQLYTLVTNGRVDELVAEYTARYITGG
ncbi:amino acid ABC transporter substrate-binding protein [Marinobacter salinus]|uniref:Amino acid ABC transporter substrate-binding protein n=2 Tax=Marinobacter salinus TaxID=1874317 RepID=A0A1D9GRS1_9GAMM|nr:amino acid ABC transporter substrate-binding protein [Marinobacter salinus]